MPDPNYNLGALGNNFNNGSLDFRPNNPADTYAANTGVLSQDQWCWGLRAYGGSNVNSTLWLAVYETTGNPATAIRVAFQSLTVGSGSPQTFSLNLTTPVLLKAGKSYRMVASSPGDFWLYRASYDDNWWRRTNSAYPPPTSFGAVTEDGFKPPQIWGVAETNAAPVVPYGLSPAANAVVTTPTPTFTFSHSDPNTDVGDKMLGASLLVERASNGDVMWAPYLTATSAEQESGTMSVVYGGLALVTGTQYRWSVRTRDLAGLYGPYSAWQTFTFTAAGQMTMSEATPPAKVEVLSGLSFAATWSHTQSLAMTTARARLAIGGSIVWEGAAAGFVPTGGNVAAGGTLTFTQTEAGMPTLSAGQTYQVAVMGKDTNGNWSSYSPYRDLRTNAPPNTPAALSPDTTQPSTTRPLLTFTGQDPDVTAGYPEADLTASVRLKDSAGVVRFTRTATLVSSAAGTWQYQITATDEPALAAGASVSRLWDTQVNDGTAVGALSAQAAYVYAAGPTVTITAPGATLAKATGPITWTIVGTQASRTVKIWAGGSATGTPLHTHTATTGSLSYTIPVGLIFNGRTYTVAVEVVDNISLTGSSPTVTTTATFPVPPAVMGASAALLAAVGEPDPSRVALSWQASTEPPDVFVSYRVTRRLSTEESTAAVLLAELVSPSQASLADEHPPNGSGLVYAISQVTRDANGFELLGAVTEMIVEALNLDALYLVNVVDPTIRVALRFPESFDVAPEKGRIELDTWAGGPALMLPTGSVRRVSSVTANVIDDMSRPDLMTAAATMTMVRALNASDSPVSVRDGRRSRWFAMADASESDRRIGASDVSLTLTEVILKEGVVI